MVNIGVAPGFLVGFGGGLDGWFPDLVEQLGTTFVRLPYAVSPPCAAVIARSGTLRRPTMAFVVRPGTQLAGYIPEGEAIVCKGY
jgi:hypothetical protein